MCFDVSTPPVPINLNHTIVPISPHPSSTVSEDGELVLITDDALYLKPNLRQSSLLATLSRT